MTHQDQIITICILAFIGIPLASFTAIKTINKLSRPPVNTLVRPGDIEMVDYIEPTHPVNTFYPDQFDLVRNQFSVLERFSYPPTYYSGSIPFYRSGSLPHYQSVDGININCCLENNINLEIILLVFIFICFLILWKMRNNPLFNIFIERFLLIHQVKIRILLKVLAVYFLNKLLFNYSLYSMSILIPFSSFEIDFRDSFEWKFKSYGVKPKISYLILQTLTEDIIKLKNEWELSMILITLWLLN